MTPKFSDYRIEIRPVEGGYMASIPQLPGCMADSQNIHHVAREISIAFDAWTEAARAHGREVPEPDDSAWVPVSERLPERWPVLTFDGTRIELTAAQPGWWNHKDSCGDEFNGPTVTHWQPLPAPPKGTK